MTLHKNNSDICFTQKVRKTQAFAFFDAGATIVEMAIALPIFFVFVLAIFDFGRVMSRHSLFSEALVATARDGTVLPPTTSGINCLTQLQASYLSSVAPFGIDTSTIQFTGSAIMTNASGQRGINFQVHVPVYCLFFGFNTDFNSTLFIPFEDPNACP